MDGSIKDLRKSNVKTSLSSWITDDRLRAPRGRGCRRRLGKSRVGRVSFWSPQPQWQGSHRVKRSKGLNSLNSYHTFEAPASLRSTLKRPPESGRWTNGGGEITRCPWLPASACSSASQQARSSDVVAWRRAERDGHRVC